MKLKYVGWQVGISYQTPVREGLSQKYVHDLVTNMKKDGMNLISFMMVSHELNDPMHDGYAWPVRNPRLRCYVDKQVINAGKKSEFLRQEIEYAADMGFHVQLFANNFWWNPKKAKIGYPGIKSLGGNDPACQGYSHDAQNEDTWQMACDEAADMLEFYNSPSVASYGWETMGSSDPAWKATLKKFAGYVRGIRSDIEIWHHGYYEFSAPRTPEAYREAGIDVVFPVIHNVVTEEQLCLILDSSKDFPLVLHVDTRDYPTDNYDVPAKSADYIERMGEWIAKHRRDNLLGVMFFNEAYTSETNKKAVRRVLGAWRNGNMF